jgi:hypothetical protein
LNIARGQGYGWLLGHIFLRENVLDKEVWGPCVNGHGFKYFAFVGVTNFVSPMQFNGNGG